MIRAIEAYFEQFTGDEPYVPYAEFSELALRVSRKGIVNVTMLGMPHRQGRKTPPIEDRCELSFVAPDGVWTFQIKDGDYSRPASILRGYDDDDEAFRLWVEAQNAEADRITAINKAAEAELRLQQDKWADEHWRQNS